MYSKDVVPPSTVSSSRASPRIRISNIFYPLSTAANERRRGAHPSMLFFFITNGTILVPGYVSPLSIPVRRQESPVKGKKEFSTCNVLALRWRGVEKETRGSPHPPPACLQRSLAVGGVPGSSPSHCYQGCCCCYLREGAEARP